MTKPLNTRELVKKIENQYSTAIVDFQDSFVTITPESVYDVCLLLNHSSGLEFDYLVDLTGVDYLDYIAVVYRLVSIKHNHGVIIKTRCFDRKKPIVPSVTPIWKGADLMEREVYDMLGVYFEGHYNMKRLLLWEGFEGHPLRRDFL